MMLDQPKAREFPWLSGEILYFDAYAALQMLQIRSVWGISLTYFVYILIHVWLQHHPQKKKRSIKNMGGKYCWKLTDMDGKVFIEIVQLVNIVGLIFMPWYVNPFHWHVLNPSHCKVPIKCCIDRVAFLFNFRLKKQCWSDDPVLKVKVHSSR